MVKIKWRDMRRGIVLFLAITVISGFAAVFAGDDDSEQSEASATKAEQALVAKRAQSPDIMITEQVAQQIPKPMLPQGMTLIKEVKIEGSTILAQEALDSIKRKYENRQVTPRMIQQAADLVTRAYAREGYITSYGYIDAQEISSGVLKIMVKEGTTGKITIEGNKTFSTEILMGKITLKEGDLFNFRQLNRDVYRINKHPDRKLNITCNPNFQTGITDVTLKVKDKSPLHAVLQMDNYGSESIAYKRHKIFLTHNNLTGHDDSLTFKAQMTESNAHKLFDLDYYYPLNPDWKFNLYFMPFKREDYVGGDNVETDFEKHAHKWYFWFTQSLIDEPGLELSSAYGYVQKDIHWWQNGRQQKSDLFRALMWGLDLNRADKYGRWVISNDVEVGIPRLFGGSTKEDESCSVAGAGGGYKKNLLVIARRQKVVADIDWISKGRWQLSSQAQPGVNVFSIGGFMGVIDMRGYPRAQAPGDNGVSLSTGFSFPPFGVARNKKVPFSKTNIYDGLRLFTFIDYARAGFKTYQEGSPKHYELTSGGCGFELKVPDQAFSVRLDIGWPLSNQMPSDGDHAHAWFAITKGF
jgi:hemolysin activation/secretion protein